MAVIFTPLTHKSHRLGRAVSRVRLRCGFILLPSSAASNTPIDDNNQCSGSSGEVGGRKPKQMKKRTKLTIETERTVVIRRGRAERRGVCEACHEVVGLLTAEEAATHARVSARAIYRLVKAGT